MKMNDILNEVNDNFGLSPEQRKLANMGRTLMNAAATTKDDALSNVMSKVGNELTNFGALFGATNLEELVKKTVKQNNDFLGNFGYEGFQNKDIFITDNGLGESSVPKGQCPEGYSRDLSSGKCIQKCIGCVYRDNMKSREFNEADPCFPNGVYNGITNEGFIKCTCGKNNKHCSENFMENNMFTTEGMMIKGQKIIMNAGLTNPIDKLFNFKYL